MAMELPRVSTSVVRVIAFETDSSGALRPITLYDKGKKRNKKQSAPLKEVGKAIRKFHDTNLSFERAYVVRHKKSNTQRRDGWARDLPLNLVRAGHKAGRKIKLI